MTIVRLLRADESDVRAACVLRRCEQCVLAVAAHTPHRGRQTLLRHPARIQPILGTTNAARIAAAARAAEIELTREEWYELYIAGRGSALP